MKYLNTRVAPLIVVGLIAVGAGLAGCGSGTPSGAAPEGSAIGPAAATSDPAAGGPATSSSAAPGADPASPDPSALPADFALPAVVSAARPRGAHAVTVRAAAQEGARTVTTLSATTSLGSARVLMVRRLQGGWAEVFLPTRPNGSTGWIRRSDVVLADVGDRLVIDLSARTLVLRSGGRQVLSTPVAVGAVGTPTPVGTFFVTDRVRPSVPGGPYGSFALGISAHSEALTEFGDGDAQIGIHGTDRPATIGTATTHGCIRVPDGVAERLEKVPLGTPVRIVT